MDTVKRVLCAIVLVLVAIYVLIGWGAPSFYAAYLAPIYNAIFQTIEALAITAALMGVAALILYALVCYVQHLYLERCKRREEQAQVYSKLTRIAETYDVDMDRLRDYRYQIDALEKALEICQQALKKLLEAQKKDPKAQIEATTQSFTI